MKVIRPGPRYSSQAHDKAEILADLQSADPNPEISPAFMILPPSTRGTVSSRLNSPTISPK
jgi:hypothetical protein